MTNFTKDPQATLDYSIDWSDWLSGDTIINSVWTVPVELQSSRLSEFNTTQTVVWLEGGEENITYQVKNTITTAGGRVDERTMTVKVANK